MNQVEINVKQLLWNAIGPDGVVILLSYVLILIVYLVVAYNSSKLSKNTRLPGSKIIAYSFWFLALFWVPVLIHAFSTDAEVDDDSLLLLILFVTVTTLPLLAAAYGYRKLVRALLADAIEPADEA